MVGRSRNPMLEKSLIANFTERWQRGEEREEEVSESDQRPPAGSKFQAV